MDFDKDNIPDKAEESDQRGSGRQKWGYTVPGSRYDVNMCTGYIYIYNYVYIYIHIIFIFVYIYIFVHIYIIYIYVYNVKLYVNYINTMCIYSYTPHTLPAPSRATCGGHPDHHALYRAWRFRSRGHQEGPCPVVGITGWCPHDMVKKGGNGGRMPVESWMDVGYGVLFSGCSNDFEWHPMILGWISFLLLISHVIRKFHNNKDIQWSSNNWDSPCSLFHFFWPSPSYWMIHHGPSWIPRPSLQLM